MSRCEIIIEDADNGTVDVRFGFAGGVDIGSRSHQLANIIRAHLDEVCVQNTPLEPFEPFAPGEELQARLAAGNVVDQSKLD